MPGKKRRKEKHGAKRAKPAIRRTRRRAQRGARRRVRAARSPLIGSVMNPIIGDSALEISYTGGEGKRKGKLRGPWVHGFESNDVEVRGRKDGSIVLKSKTGKRLWDFFEV